MKRPILITIIALLAIISGLMEMLSSFGIGVSSIFTGLHSADPKALDGMKALHWGCILVFIIGLFTFLYGLGMWKLKKWAWWLAVLFYVLMIASDVKNYTNTTDQNTKSGILIGLIVCGLLLLFMLSGHVRRAFRIGNQN